jgi:hypothetical protein
MLDGAGQPLGPQTRNHRLPLLFNGPWLIKKAIQKFIYLVTARNGMFKMKFISLLLALNGNFFIHTPKDR